MAVSQSPVLFSPMPRPTNMGLYETLPPFSSPALNLETPLPFPAFGRATPQTPQTPLSQPPTPIQTGIYVLAPGDFDQNLLRKIQSAHRSASPPPFFPLKSPASIASPMVPGERGRFTPLGLGSSHPFRYRGLNDAFFKAYQLEPGACRNPVEKGDCSKQIPGCPPEMRSYIDFLCTMYIRNLLRDFQEEGECPILPKAAYVQVGDPALRLTQRTPHALPIRGTGLFSEFLNNMRSFSSFEELDKTNPKELEIVAVADIALGNSDRNLTNLGYSGDGKVVIYDHALCLSEEALALGKFCWLNCTVLNGEPSSSIVDFINRMDPYALGTLDRAISDEIETNLRKLPDAQKKGESRSLGLSRIIPHQIAVVFMQKAVANGWPLSKIADTLYSKNAKRTNLLHELYNEVTKNHEGLEFLPKIHRVCDQYFTSYKSSPQQSDSNPMAAGEI